MRAKQFTTEAAIGTNPKRPAREGSRPERGHEAQPRYKTEEGFDYTMKDLGNDYSGFPSNHSLKHKMLKRISPEHHQLYRDKMNNTHDSDQLVKLFHVAKARGHVIDEGTSDAMANAAKRLTDPNDGKVAKLRAAGDKRREEHLKSRDIAKKNETIDSMAAELEEAKAPRALCKSSTPDEDLGASQLASCKSQGLRARDGEKSHKLGKSAKSRVKVGGKRIKGNKYGGPLPDWS